MTASFALVLSFRLMLLPNMTISVKDVGVDAFAEKRTSRDGSVA